MFTRLTRTRVAAMTAILCMGLTTGMVALSTGCATNANEYKDPDPAISAFTTGTMNGTTFTATTAGTPFNIAPGGSAWFRANFAAKDGKAIVTPGNIPVESNVPFQITNITTTTPYLLTVSSGSGKTTTATSTVTVLAVPANLTYSKEDATYYVGVQITANTPTVAGATPMSFTVNKPLPAGLSLSATTGAITGTPQVVGAQDTYTITATNQVGSTTRDIKVAVADTPITLAVAPSAIAPGGGAILSWDTTSVAGLFSSVNITANPADSSLVGPFGLSSVSKPVSPAVTTTYTLSATPASGGPAVTKSVDLTVGSAPVRFTSFTAAPTVVPFGNTTTLSWTGTGLPVTLTLDGTNVLGSSSKVVTPQRRQTFTLAGANSLGSDTATVSSAARGLDLLAGKTGGVGVLNGPRGRALFNNPQSIAADATGNLYLAETGNHVIRKIATDGTVSIFAGKPNSSGSTNATGNPLNALFNSPRGVFPDSKGYIWVCDSSNYLLRVITPTNDVKTVTGWGGTNAVSPNQIVVVSNDGATAVGYIADYKGSVAKLTINLTTMAATSTTIGGFAASGPAGICADDNGIVYVVDTAAGLIKAIKNGVVSSLTGHGITFNAPYAIAAITNGSNTMLLVAEPGTASTANNRVYRFTVDNSAATPAAVAGSGITLAGSAAIGADDGKGDAATFAGPKGIVVVGTTAYVVDSNNSSVIKNANFLPADITKTTSVFSNTIRTISNVKDAASAADTTVSTFAGTSRIAAQGNLPATGTTTSALARFSNPQGLVADAAGNIYVVDTGNNKVRKITPAGVVSNYPNDATTYATPFMVTLDAAGVMYVLERGATNCGIQKIGTDGTKTAIPVSGLSASTAGIVADPAGTYVYVTDQTKIKQIKVADGTVVASTATFSKLVGITMDASKVLYVVDGSQVKSLTAIDAASATVIAGVATNTSGFLDDATGTIAKLNQPNGLAYIADGAQGYLFVSDFYSSAIRKITLGGTNPVTTVIGRPNSTNGSAGLFGTIAGRVIGEEDATNLEGSIYRPAAIAVTPKGDLVISVDDTVMQLTAPLNK